MTGYSPNRRLKQAVWSATYASKSPETFIRRLLNKRRYLKKAVSLEYLMSLWNIQEGLCALSGVPMTHLHGKGHLNTNISIDKINPYLGYVEGNIQLVCRVVNHMKWINSTERLIWWCHKITIKLGNNEKEYNMDTNINTIQEAPKLTAEEFAKLLESKPVYVTEGEEPTEDAAEEPVTIH